MRTADKRKLTIFLGDVQDYLGDLAKAQDASAWLLDRSNFDQLALLDNDTTVYTSLGDLPKDPTVIYNILRQADTIVYCPPSKWSDDKTIDITKPDLSIHGFTEILLMLLPKSIEIKNFKPITPGDYDPRPLVAHRKSPHNSQLWIVGCSISHGLGITPEQRYGKLLADALDLDCSFLTRPGSAIDWAADQILRSDIQQNDLIIWGLTSWNRLTYVDSHQLLSGVTASTYQQHPEYNNIVSIDQLLSQQTFYTHYYAIQQVINYCKKNDSKLFLAGLFPNNYSLLGFLQSQPNYIHIPYQLQYNNSKLSEVFLDLGTDKLHPGPKQHQAYKDTILDFINQAN